MLSIFSSSGSSVPTCLYYRVQLPLRKMQDDGHSVLHMLEDSSETMLVPATFASDVTWLYLPSHIDKWHQIATSARKISPVETHAGVRYPPIYVWDGDDNVNLVSPFNEAFHRLGTRNMDGTRLQPGDVVATVDGNGNEVIMWEDLVTAASDGAIFNIERNQKVEAYRNAFIKNCEGATAVSPQLASYYRDALGQKNVHVFPNTIIPEDYQSNIKTVRTDSPDTVRILWQGGQSHLVDWLPLKDAVAAIAKKYPNTKWVFMGLKLPFIMDAIPPAQVEFTPWEHHDAYKLRRTLLNIDINLCPLLDNPFNRCKSAIKWYESVVTDAPEVTLAQNTGPYHEIKDGETGLLFNNAEEFAQKLALLIEDAELRKRLGGNAKDWVWNNRLPQHTIPGLVDFFEDLKSQQRTRLNPKIIVGGTS